MAMHSYDPNHFWTYVWGLKGAVTARVFPRVLVFTAFATLVTVASRVTPHLKSALGPAEVVGVALGVLLVLRTNAGYDRWWEARKLWGGIVNQSRNLAVDIVAYGPSAPDARDRLVRFAAAFSHVARRSLRGERELPEVAALIGKEEADATARAAHMPSHIALRIGMLLREAVERGGMDRFAFLAADRERALLIDHVGACERILKTPLPLVYVIKIRRLVAFYLIGLPFALVGEIGWSVPLITMVVAYALLGVDQIAVELENPFAVSHLSHLPLNEICRTIEGNLLGLTGEPSHVAPSSDGASDADRPQEAAVAWMP